MTVSKARLLVPACAAALVLGACDAGDWFPFERTSRALFNGWDMWETAAVSPHERPMPPVPGGVVPVGGLHRFDEARARLDAMPAAEKDAGGALSWRRYCHHCHGKNGDGRTIVGESFSPAIPDLRQQSTQDFSDRDIYDIIMGGVGAMVPLDDTVTLLEALFAIHHMRSLKDAPSKPFFAPQSSVPIK